MSPVVIGVLMVLATICTIIIILAWYAAKANYASSMAGIQLAAMATARDQKLKEES